MRDSPLHPQQQPQAQRYRQRHQAQAPRIRSRNGAMGGLGLWTFDAVSFKNKIELLMSHQSEQDQNQQPYSAAGHINFPCHLTLPHQIHLPSREEPDHFLG
jgi:hypothetical protein